MTKVKSSLAKVAGENVKRSIRHSRFGTQAEFAYALGVDERTVGRWCNEGLDSLTALEQAAALLGVSVKDLLSL